MTSNLLVHFSHKHIHVQLLYQMDHELLRSSIKMLAISTPKFRAQFRFLKRLFSCCVNIKHNFYLATYLQTSREIFVGNNGGHWKGRKGRHDQEDAHWNCKHNCVQDAWTHPKANIWRVYDSVPHADHQAPGFKGLRWKWLHKFIHFELANCENI